MKYVFSSNSAEVGLVKNLLQEAGIESEERNETVQLQGGSFSPELWVDDADYPAAMEILKKWRCPTPSSEASWVCPKCGEVQGPQFESCWKCGTPRTMLA